MTRIRRFLALFIISARLEFSKANRLRIAQLRTSSRASGNEKKKRKNRKIKRKKKRSRKGRVGIILHVDFHESYISTGAPHPLEQKAFPGHRRRFSMIAKSNEAEV